MPSPIAHTAVGYAIYKIYIAHSPKNETAGSFLGPVPRALVVTSVLSLLPDMDIFPSIILRQVDQIHNNLTHSLLFGLLVAPLIATIMSFRKQSRFTFWFVLSLVCYELHVLMDYFTVGRGVMLLWPFSATRYQPPIKLFYGLHRSDGWFSIRHLWTLLTELMFAAFIWLAIHARWLPPFIKEEFNRD